MIILTIELNTSSGIMANMPSAWFDSDENTMSVIQRGNGVVIHITGNEKVVMQWFLNLGADGRYKLLNV